MNQSTRHWRNILASQNTSSVSLSTFPTVVSRIGKPHGRGGMSGSGTGKVRPPQIVENCPLRSGTRVLSVAACQRMLPHYAGRLFYWFGDKALTQAWFEQEFRKARDTLGSRYTPETNIELPVRGIPRQTMRYSTANANSVRPHVRTAKPVAATVARCAIDMKALQPQEHMRTHSAALRSWRSWKIGEFEFLAKVRIGGGGRWALVGDYPAMKPAQKGTTFFPV